MVGSSAYGIKLALTSCVVAVLGIANSSAECQAAFFKCHKIEGKLTKQHVDELTEVAPSIQYLVIDFPGGGTGWGMAIGDLVFEHDLPLVVTGMCASSCLEFIVPASRFVVAWNQPVFAAHSNPLIFRDIADERGIVVGDDCDFFLPAEWLDQIYQARSLSYDFVDLQRTGLKKNR